MPVIGSMGMAQKMLRLPTKRCGSAFLGSRNVHERSSFVPHRMNGSE